MQPLLLSLVTACAVIDSLRAGSLASGVHLLTVRQADVVAHEGMHGIDHEGSFFPGILFAAERLLCSRVRPMSAIGMIRLSAGHSTSYGDGAGIGPSGRQRAAASDLSSLLLIPYRISGCRDPVTNASSNAHGEGVATCGPC